MGKNHTGVRCIHKDHFIEEAMECNQWYLIEHTCMCIFVVVYLAHVSLLTICGSSPTISGFKADIMCVPLVNSLLRVCVCVQSPCSMYIIEKHVFMIVCSISGISSLYHCINYSNSLRQNGTLGGKWGLVISKSGCVFIWFGCCSIPLCLSQMKHLGLLQNSFVTKVSQVKIRTVCAFLDYNCCLQRKT